MTTPPFFTTDGLRFVVAGIVCPTAVGAEATAVGAQPTAVDGQPTLVGR